MPSVWNHEADKDLLLAIIEMGTLKSIMWPDIAAKMKAKNYTFTQEACRQHFQKMRKDSKSANGSSTGKRPASPSTSNTNTPRKRQSSAKKSTKSAASSFSTSKTADSNKSSSFYQDDADGDDDEEDYETPIKTQDRAGGGNGPLKQESGEGLFYGGQNARLFKVEDASSDGRKVVVDLENDDLYDYEA